MEMLDGSKDFRVQILWVVSALSQRGVDPGKHARSRPMGLNILWFSHGVFSRSLNDGSSAITERQSAESCFYVPMLTPCGTPFFGVSFFLALRLTAPLIQWRAAQNPNMSGNNQYITSNNLRRIAVGLD
jgi:hypothetical protein